MDISMVSLLVSVAIDLYNQIMQCEEKRIVYAIFIDYLIRDIKEIGCSKNFVVIRFSIRYSSINILKLFRNMRYYMYLLVSSVETKLL